MRTILVIGVLSALSGTIIGAALAYVQVGSPREVAAEIGGQSGPTPTDVAVAGEFPRIEVDQLEYDFGKMQRGTEQSHRFKISNEGDAPLRLETGKPSCKCTVSKLDTNVLKPGETVELQVTWKAQADEGPFRQRVPVTTNDPNQSQFELTVVGEITRPTGLVPREFYFSKMRAGDSRAAKVFLMSYLQDDVKIERAEIASEDAREHFDILIEPINKEELPDKNAAAGVLIKLIAKPSLPIGRFSQWLELDTNLPDIRHLEVPVNGHITGDIGIRGQSWNEEQGVLRLGSVSSGEGKKVTLNIIIRGEHAAGVEVEVDPDRVDPPELIATLGERREYKDKLFHVPLTIEIPKGTRPMVHLNPNLHEPASVTLKTSHPQAPEIQLNIRFAVER